LSRLCDQYMAALDLLRELDIDLCGEFLVMASTLVLIKSRAILPREEIDLQEEIDPGDELILQLLEYRRYKTLSLALCQRAARHPARAARRAGPAGRLRVPARRGARARRGLDVGPRRQLRAPGRGARPAARLRHAQAGEAAQGLPQGRARQPARAAELGLPRP